MVHGERTASAKALGKEHASCCPRDKRGHVAGVSRGNAGDEGEGGGEPFSRSSLRQGGQRKVQG